MKKPLLQAQIFRRFAPVLAMYIISCVLSCKRTLPDDGGQGSIAVFFSETSYTQTKSITQLPDTCDFLLSITGAEGKSIFAGKFGDCPKEVLVAPGSYTVSVVSSEFKSPSFSTPIFGDEQCIVVTSGKKADVYLTCSQMNSGVRLLTAPDFLTTYPDGVLFLKSKDGRLMYGYRERRFAYFKPGSVSLVLSNGGKEKTIYTKALEAAQMMTLKVSAPDRADGEGSIKISIDTSRQWIDDNLVIGDGSSSGTGGSANNAISVGQAMTEIGAEDIWVYGYIAGGDLTSSSMSFEPPFKSNTNIAIASRRSVTDKEDCMAVQLNKGQIRDALNLVTNEELLGRKVFLKGDIVEAYFGIPGLKNITDFRLE